MTNFIAGHNLHSICPPHIQTLRDISMFSPPQTSMPSSYQPSSSNQRLSMANNPPATSSLARENLRAKNVVMIAIIKLHIRIIFRSIFSLNRKVSSILAMIVIIKLHIKVNFRNIFS